MSQPTSYTPATDFSNEEAASVSGRSTVRTAELDAEFAALALTLGEVLANMAALQRDDLELIDQAVKLHTLSTEVLALMGSAGFTIHDPIGWLTATSYPARDMVTQGTGTYVSVVAHTSGVFATDLAAGKWVLIFDTVNYVASAVGLTPTGDVAATNVQAGIAELASEKSRKDANLSDLSSASTARTNISVYSKAEIQNASGNSCAAGGTVDVITGAYSPAIGSLTNNMLLMFEAVGANATSTPTFSPDGLTAKTIVRPDGNPLYVGDIPAANAKVIVVYDASLDKWILVNPFYAGPHTTEDGKVLTSQGPGLAPAYESLPSEAGRIGQIIVWPGIDVPSNAFECDGTAYSRTTYSALFAKLVKSAAATISIASPGVVTWTAHGLQNNMPIKFTTTGALPTGLLPSRKYWIINKATDTFQLALTPGGVAINTSGSQSGVHTAICAPFGDGDGSNTFNVPDARDRTFIGYGAPTISESVAAADVSTGSDYFTVPDNNDKWVTGTTVVLTTTGGLPTGLSLATTYWIVRAAAGQVKFSTSLANAQNGTVIDLTTQGTGVHTMTHTRPVRGLGEDGGEDVHAMSLSELLAHIHFAVTAQAVGVSSSPNVSSGSGATQYNINTASAGGNAAMNNMSPYLGARWIIYYS